MLTPRTFATGMDVPPFPEARAPERRRVDRGERVLGQALGETATLLAPDLGERHLDGAREAVLRRERRPAVANKEHARAHAAVSLSSAVVYRPVAAVLLHFAR